MEYNISKVTQHKACYCTCEINLKSSHGNSKITYQDLEFTRESDECWVSQEIIINDVTFEYEPSRGGIEVIKGNIEDLDYNKDDYNSIEEFLQEILNYDIYNELTEDDYDGSGDNHKELYLNTLKNYIENNDLIPFMDDCRNFNNEWNLYLIPKKYVDKIDDVLNVRELTIEECLDCVESSFDYQYNCTNFYVVTWIDED